MTDFYADNGTPLYAKQEGPCMLVPIPAGTTHYQSECLSEDATMRFFSIVAEEGNTTYLVWDIDPKTHKPGWVLRGKRFSGPLSPLNPCG